MHEDFTRHEEIQGSSDRSFGLVMAAFFAIVGLWPLIHGSLALLRWWALAVGAVFTALALLHPRILRPLNRLWLRFGLLLAAVISPLVLAILFYLTIAPIGFLMRVAGKDPMRLRRNSSAESYWIDREPPGPAPESMRRNSKVKYMLSFLREFWAFLRRPEKILAAADPRHDGRVRGLIVLTKGSAIAPFIYTLF